MKKKIEFSISEQNTNSQPKKKIRPLSSATSQSQISQVTGSKSCSYVPLQPDFHRVLVDNTNLPNSPDEQFHSPPSHQLLSSAYNSGSGYGENKSTTSSKTLVLTINLILLTNNNIYSTYLYLIDFMSLHIISDLPL